MIEFQINLQNNFQIRKIVKLCLVIIVHVYMFFKGETIKRGGCLGEKRISFLYLQFSISTKLAFFYLLEAISRAVVPLWSLRV